VQNDAAYWRGAVAAKHGLPLDYFEKEVALNSKPSRLDPTLWQRAKALIGFGEAPEYKLAPGWYARADGARGGETFERGMFDAFTARDVREQEFVVTAAPAGYRDTLGRRFKKGSLSGGNHAD
jgi:hypothetical protein